MTKQRYPTRSRDAGVLGGVATSPSRLVLAAALVIAMADAPGAGLRAVQVVGVGGSGGGGGNTVVFSGPPAASLPPLPPGVGAISGTIVDAATGAPLGDALVTLAIQARAGVPQRRVGQQLTDRRGRFVFVDLPASDGYLLTVRRNAYFDAAFGAEPGNVTGMPLLLGDGDWFDRANVKLWPTGAIAGAVVDERGEPVAGAYVRVLRQLMVAGRVHLAPSTPVTTDDRGAYRLAGLDPGRYLVCAPIVQSSVAASASLISPDAASVVEIDPATRLMLGRYPVPPSRQGQTMTHATSCYPNGASMSQASPVDVRYGAGADGIDIRLQAVPAFRVSGQVEGAADPGKLTLRLVPAGAEELGQGSEAATALAAADGSFAFVNVPSGEYVIDASSAMSQYEYSPQSSAARFAQLPRPPMPAGAGGSISGMSVPSAPPRTGLRTQSIGASKDSWGRASVVVSGRDVTGVVVPMQAAAAIRGRIVYEGQAERPQISPFLVAEPADGNPAQSKTRTFSPNDPGDRFAIEGLTPGRYLLHGPSAVWIVKSVVVDGSDVTHTPLDLRGRDVNDVVITFTDKPATIGGAVRGSDGVPATDAAVVIFPVEKSAWTNYGISPARIRSAVPGTAGSFQVASLPAGDYLVVAVDAAERASWQDPAWLEAASRGATHVSVDWGETKTVNLVKGGVR
jgi:hypothetical protein